MVPAIEKLPGCIRYFAGTQNKVSDAWYGVRSAAHWHSGVVGLVAFGKVFLGVGAGSVKTAGQRLPRKPKRLQLDGFEVFSNGELGRGQISTEGRGVIPSLDCNFSGFDCQLSQCV